MTDETFVYAGETVTPEDRDIELITRYLTHNMPADERSAVEHRLKEDHDFYMYVSPLIKLWQIPADWGAVLDARAAERAREAESPSRAREPNAEYRFNPRPQQAVAEKEKVKDPWDVKLMDYLTEGGWKMLKVAVVIWAAVLVPLVTYEQWLEKPRDSVVVIAQNDVPATVIPGSTFIETKAGEQREITLRGGSRIVLRGGTRFWYKYLGLPKGATGTLQGEFAAEVTPNDSPLLFNTAVGSILLTRGSYAIRCNAGCTAMLVAVGAVGYTYLKSADTTHASTTLMKNENGVMKKGEVPHKVGDEFVYDWPKLLAPQPAGTP